MLTVAIMINGQPIYARTVVNINDRMEKNDKGETPYKTDNGEILWHNPEDGALALARKALNTIHEEV